MRISCFRQTFYYFNIVACCTIWFKRNCLNTVQEPKYRYFNRISKNASCLFFFIDSIYDIHRNIFVFGQWDIMFSAKETWNLFRFERKLNCDEYIASARKNVFNNTDCASDVFGHCVIYIFGDDVAKTSSLIKKRFFANCVWERKKNTRTQTMHVVL